MRALSILLIVAGIAVGATTAYIAARQSVPQPAPAPLDGGFVSGPQVGRNMPGPFEPLHLNGADAGEESCMYCKYGNNPVVMVFARGASRQLADLIRKLETVTALARREVGACVVVTDPSESARTELKGLIEQLKLQHVVLAVIDPARLKAYALHPEAETTLIFLSKQVVRENRALRAGELTEPMVSDIAEKAARHFGLE